MKTRVHRTGSIYERTALRDVLVAEAWNERRVDPISPAYDRYYFLDQRARCEVFEETFFYYTAQYMMERLEVRRPQLGKVVTWLEANTLAIPFVKALEKADGDADMAAAMEWMSKSEKGTRRMRLLARCLTRYSRFNNKKARLRELAIRVSQACASSERGVKRRRLLAGHGVSASTESEDNSSGDETIEEESDDRLEEPVLNEVTEEVEPTAVKDETLYSILLDNADNAGDGAWGNDFVSRMYDELPAEG